jgi:hypothetical protein
MRGRKCLRRFTAFNEKGSEEGGKFEGLFRCSLAGFFFNFLMVSFSSLGGEGLLYY